MDEEDVSVFPLKILELITVNIISMYLYKQSDLIRFNCHMYPIVVPSLQIYNRTFLKTVNQFKAYLHSDKTYARNV